MSSAVDIDDDRAAMRLALAAVEDARRALLARLGGEVEVSAVVPPDLSDKKRWLTVKDAAAWCRVHYQTMLEWIATGRVIAMKSGRETYVDATSLPIQRACRTLS